VHRTIDYLGNGLILASLFSLLLAATSIQNYGIESPWVLGGLLTFVVLFPAFLLVERRVAFPVVELRIFRQRTFAFANLTSFLISMPRFTPPIVLGLYFQSVLGDSALLAGVKVIPIPVGITIGSLIASRLVKFSSNHLVASAGSIVMSTGFIALIFVMNGHESYWATAVPMFVIGFGSGVFLPTNSTIIIQEAPTDRDRQRQRHTSHPAEHRLDDCHRRRIDDRGQWAAGRGPGPRCSTAGRARVSASTSTS